MGLFSGTIIFRARCGYTFYGRGVLRRVLLSVSCVTPAKMENHYHSIRLWDRVSRELKYIYIYDKDRIKQELTLPDAQCIQRWLRWARAYYA